MNPLLETKNLTRTYGGIIAVNNVDFKVEEGSITGLIGPNGAGKTTLFNNITGLDTPTEGKVLFGGKEITGFKTNKIAELGISRTFQNIRLFSSLSVIENLMIAQNLWHNEEKGKFFKAIYSYVKAEENMKVLESEVQEALGFMHLEDVKESVVKNLPYGRQRHLEIARALVMKPKLLFLDEPAAGMNPSEKVELADIIGRIRDMGITVVLIEHDMRLVMSICDRITVLNYGQKIADGAPKEIKENKEVIEAYLGGSINE